MVTRDFIETSAPAMLDNLFCILDQHNPPGWEKLVPVQEIDFALPENDLAALTGCEHLFNDRQTALACGILVPEDHDNSLLLEDGVVKYTILTSLAKDKIRRRHVTSA
ncbi:MAG TPA: hypothetical protein VHD31_01840 [Candidatus Paceibacterota bacterium]|nr:hypothetical protein [Candidatus Paceibacterota bacterium]